MTKIIVPHTQGAKADDQVIQVVTRCLIDPQKPRDPHKNKKKGKRAEKGKARMREMPGQVNQSQQRRDASLQRHI